MTLSLESSIIESVDPLIHRHSFRVVMRTVTSFGAEVFLNHGKVGLLFRLDWAEWRVFLDVYELDALADPTVPTHGIHIDADRILIARGHEGAPVGSMLVDRDPSAVATIVGVYVEALQARAPDLLSGDATALASFQH